MQALSNSETCPRSLKATVEQVTRSSQEHPVSPPAEVTNRLLRACRIHRDTASLSKLADMLDRPGVLRNDETLQVLNECYTYCPPQTDEATPKS